MARGQHPTRRLTLNPQLRLLVLLQLILTGPMLWAAEDVIEPPAASIANLSTEELTSAIRASLVTIRVRDRDGDELGLGTGFVVDESGLIATNMHVISEGRPIEVELWPNQKLDVLGIEATSRSNDLALIRVAPDNHKLVAIPLGDDTTIDQGVQVLAFGNPLGLRHSVVQGVVSALRDIDSREMIQIAIPIEPGNSGGPLVDLSGTVRGIINMKSLQIENVGFAIPVSKLRELIQSPNPISIGRWVRLSGIDADRWQPVFGAQWRERSGIMEVSGQGAGFGGRSLCIYQSPVPSTSFEVAVNVKLDDESGAAGLIFHADGQDKHYGFYPSSGKLRLTCFQGPSVYSWEVIEDIDSSHYVPGQWNNLKVRVEPNSIQCFVNGELVIASKHAGLTNGKVGLAKFRNTKAEFRKFQCAESIPEDELNDETKNWFDNFPDLDSADHFSELESIESLATTSEASVRELMRNAKRLNEQANRLVRLADDVRVAPVLQKLKDLFMSHDDDDLLHGSLLIASLRHPDLDIETYLMRFDAMADEISTTWADGASDDEKLASIDRYLFEENGFRGGQDEYYHEANNHMDRVIDDREGMPITLTILYMELGRRLGLTIEGVGLPGHFVARYRSDDGKTQLIDVFDKARRIDDDEAGRLVMMNRQRRPTEDDFKAQLPKEILVRMLHNLVGSAERTRDLDAIRLYTEGLVALDENEAEYRFMRGITRYQSGRLQAASADFEWLITRNPEHIDLDRVRVMQEQVQRQVSETRSRLTP